MASATIRLYLRFKLITNTYGSVFVQAFQYGGSDPFLVVFEADETSHRGQEYNNDACANFVLANDDPRWISAKIYHISHGSKKKE